MKGFSRTAQRQARFYHGSPTLEEAIEKLELAQDLLIDVGHLMGENWRGGDKKLLMDQAEGVGAMILRLKDARYVAVWRR